MSVAKMFATPYRIAYQVNIEPPGSETILQTTIVADLPPGPLRAFIGGLDPAAWTGIMSRPELKFDLKAIDSGAPGCFYSVAPDGTEPNAMVVGASGSAPGTGMLEIIYVHTMFR